MSRAKKGPRLFLRQRDGRAAVFVILDSDGFERSTGCGPGEERGAEEALRRYLAGKHESAVGTHDPAGLPIADLLSFYAEAKEPKPDAPTATRRAYAITLIRVDHLLTFFGDKATTEVRGAICRDYVRWRTHEGACAKGWPDRRAKPTSDQTARRELVILSAAIGLYHKEYGLDVIPVVTLPERKPSARTALTREDAARLLAGALGFFRDDMGKIRRRARFVRTHRKRTARFIIIGLYSGTRHSAITAGRWITSLDAPWIDVDRGVLHRRGQAEGESRKRRPPARIPPRLLVHLRRWRDADLARGEIHVISRRGKPLAGQLRKGWAGARSDAGLGREMVPHVLRHTAATWLAQGGVRARQAADYLGMSEATFERVYYSASPDYQAEIGPGFDAARAASSRLRRQGNRTASEPKNAQETGAFPSTKREQSDDEP